MEEKFKKEKKDIGAELGKLEKIVRWFESQKEIDVEKGLLKVREGAKLIKDLRQRIKEVENEFEEIKKDLSEDRESERR